MGNIRVSISILLHAQSAVPRAAPGPSSGAPSSRAPKMGPRGPVQEPTRERERTRVDLLRVYSPPLRVPKTDLIRDEIDPTTPGQTWPGGRHISRPVPFVKGTGSPGSVPDAASSPERSDSAVGFDWSSTASQNMTGWRRHAGSDSPGSSPRRHQTRVITFQIQSRHIFS